MTVVTVAYSGKIYHIILRLYNDQVQDHRKRVKLHITFSSATWSTLLVWQSQSLASSSLQISYGCSPRGMPHGLPRGMPWGQETTSKCTRSFKIINHLITACSRDGKLCYHGRLEYDLLVLFFAFMPCFLHVTWAAMGSHGLPWDAMGCHQLSSAAMGCHVAAMGAVNNK